MKNKVLIIDNYDSFTYNLRQIVEEFHYEYSVFKNNQLSFEEIDEYNKILITPGPGLPSEAGIVKEMIKKYEAKKSILGICLGHQAIAEVFGSELYNFSKVCHGITTSIDVILPTDYIFENISNEFEAGLYHSWAVSKNNFPDCLKITATSRENVIMAISHKMYDVKGVQFHPESIMTKQGARIIENWLRH